MTMLLGAVRAGDVLAEKYRVERILGAGGMGVVVAARHELLRERVAVKLLSPERTLNKSFVRRFLTEARSMVRLKSEHIVRVLDVGALDGGIPYLVMELLEGEDLACHLNEQGPLPAQLAADYVHQACIGLAEAHSHGLVHRDLKPANLFLTKRPDGSPFVKVLDFGVAKRFDDSVEATKTGQLVGSPNYMAPEQVSSPSSVDPRADVWALGVILYELISGTRPFSGTTVYEVFGFILHDPPKPLRQLVPTLSPDLDAVISRCLEKDRGRRFDCVDALRAALAPFAAGVAPSYVSAPALAPAYGMSASPESTLLLSPALVSAAASRTHAPSAPAQHAPSAPALHAPSTPTPSAPAPTLAPQHLPTPLPGHLLSPPLAPPPGPPPAFGPDPSSYPGPSTSSPQLFDTNNPWSNNQQADQPHIWVWPLRAVLAIAAVAGFFFFFNPKLISARAPAAVTAQPAPAPPPPNADAAQRPSAPKSPTVAPSAAPPKPPAASAAPPRAAPTAPAAPVASAPQPSSASGPQPASDSAETAPPHSPSAARSLPKGPNSGRRPAAQPTAKRRDESPNFESQHWLLIAAPRGHRRHFVRRSTAGRAPPCPASPGPLRSRAACSPPHAPRTPSPPTRPTAPTLRYSSKKGAP